VYVPGEIFDVIGMKGELWLARTGRRRCAACLPPAKRAPA
jgi:hypothetical protein